jgi:hypothetical protein
MHAKDYWLLCEQAPTEPVIFCMRMAHCYTQNATTQCYCAAAEKRKKKKRKK